MLQMLKDISILCLPLILGFSSGLIRSSDWLQYYNKLKRAPWNPPPWVFGPAWTILYLLIGASLVRICDIPSTSFKFKLAIFTFCIQFVLNLIWSPCFFKLKRPVLSLMIISQMWLAILFNIFVFFQIDQISGFLLMPYFIWVSYATSLNYFIVTNNKTQQ
jgi:translocator protein